MNAISIFGFATMLLGAIGTCVTVEASRGVFAIPRAGSELADCTVLLMLCFIFLVDVMVVVAGGGVVMLEL